MHGLDWYDFHARQYDPVLARFHTIDPMAEKYYSISPCAYVGNNPIRNIDINGDSISVAQIQKYDEEHGTNYLNQMINDLQSQTGLTYSVSPTGMLVYATKGIGNEIIRTKNNSNGEIVQAGSQEGRNLMKDAIKHSTIVYTSISNSSNSKSIVGGNRIRLNPSQINNFIVNSNGLDNRTMGWGMTFMHEILHSGVGVGLRDPHEKLLGLTGAVVNRMNIVRS